MAIVDALNNVLEKISQSAVRAGRRPEQIKLVAVSKTVTLDKIIEAVKAGVSILGENRVQEAQNKISDFRLQIPDLGIEWHLIGHLQKNKAKAAIRLFDLIHSLDTAELARIIDNQCRQTGKKQRVLVQVKLAYEESKHGVPEEDFFRLLEKTAVMNNVVIEGLMTMPPFYDNPEMARPYFRKLGKLRNRAEARGFRLPELSMGMSNDYEVAIEEGATIVRVGSAIFGERDR